MNPLLAELLRKDDERRRAQIEANRIGPTSGMTDPYQPQDFSGQEAKIAQMRSMANSLRGQPAPEGRTVGPLNVYVRPDGAKAMQHGINQIASYMADKEANALGKTLEAQKSKDMQGQFEYQDAIDTRDFNADRADALSNQQYREGVLEGQDASREQRAEIYEMEAEARAAEAEADRIAMLEAARIKAMETGQKQQSKSDEKLNDLVLKYSKEIQKTGLPKAEVTMNVLNDVIDQFKDESGEIDNLPGVGGVQNYQMGQVFTLVGDAWDKMLDKNQELPSGKDVNRAVQDVLNAKMTDEAGKAQTVQEVVRQRLGSGFDIFSSDQNLIQGLKTIGEIFKEKREVVDAGFPEEVREEYARRRGAPPVPAIRQEKEGPESDVAEGTVVADAQGNKLILRNGNWEPYDG